MANHQRTDDIVGVLRSVPHTPGPWILLRDPCHFDSATTVEASGIARIDVGGSASLAELEANARLIAAAPDLLALIYQYRDDMRHGVAELGARGRRLEAIEAVIASVEGR